MVVVRFCDLSEAKISCLFVYVPGDIVPEKNLKSFSKLNIYRIVIACKCNERLNFPLCLSAIGRRDSAV